MPRKRFSRKVKGNLLRSPAPERSLSRRAEGTQLHGAEGTQLHGAEGTQLHGAEGTQSILGEAKGLFGWLE